MFVYVEDKYAPEKYWGVVECQRIVTYRDIGHAPTDYEFIDVKVLRNDSGKLNFMVPFKACDFNLYEYETLDDLFNEHVVHML